MSAAPDDRPLTGRRALVPPSRPDIHPLQKMLERAGARVVVFPRLAIQEYDPSESSEALEHWFSFDWVVVSGAPSARRLLRYVCPAMRPEPGKGRIATVGAGATAELRRAGLRPDCVPRRHTAEDVTDALELQPGLRVLLVREHAAATALPNRIRSLGASTTEVEGYRIHVQAGAQRPDEAHFDFVAFSNPTAVRLLIRGLRELDVSWRPDASMGVAVAGPATAEAAEDAGMKPTLVAEGSLRPLLMRLIERYGAGRTTGTAVR